MVSSYLKRSPSDVELEWDICGSRRRLITGADGSPASIHVTTMSGARPHFHRTTTEYYYVLEGSGRLMVDGEPVPLEMGDVVMVRPGATHHAEGELTCVVMGVPPFDPADQHLDA